MRFSCRESSPVICVGAVESGHLRIGTQRAGFARRRPVGGDQTIRCLSQFDLLLDCRKQVELVRELSESSSTIPNRPETDLCVNAVFPYGLHHGLQVFQLGIFV